MFGTLNNETIDKTSFAQMNLLAEEIRIFDNYGSNGNSLIWLPIDVRSPSSSSAPRKLSYSKALIKVSGAGGSI